MEQRDNRKKEGFQGQKAIVIPRDILIFCNEHPVAGRLYITDIGYYPNAKFHYITRPNGIEQHILIYCLDGKGEAAIENKKYKIESGDFLLIPAKTNHSYKADENRPWSIYWIHFKGYSSNAIISLFIKQNNGNKGFLAENKSSLRLFDEMYHQLQRGYSSEHLIYSNMCLWHFLAVFIYGNVPDETSITNGTDYINRVIDYMTNNLHQMLSIDEIAFAANISTSHLSYLFKKSTGFTVIGYFNHLKIQKACQYLLFTSLRIKEISLELGIQDTYYFSRLFAKTMGLSPQEYRKKRLI